MSSRSQAGRPFYAADYVDLDPHLTSAKQENVLLTATCCFSAPARQMSAFHPGRIPRPLTTALDDYVCYAERPAH